MSNPCNYWIKGFNKNKMLGKDLKENKDWVGKRPRESSD